MEIALQIVSLFGGLGMFLFGMNTMSGGLEKAAGDRLRRIMEKVTGNLFKSVFLGICVAGLTQSSSAATVMVVGFVNAGLLTLSQAAGIIMGANIGTTVTAWLISLNSIPGGVWYLDILKPDTIAPVALIVGAVFMFFSGKDKKKAVVGEIIAGLGILFIGMSYMSGAMQKVFEIVPSLKGMFAFCENPIIGIGIGAAVTAVIQSSAASVGMLQAIASTGALYFCTTFPIIMGQNIGTCVTALLSSIGTSKNARRAAMIHLYFNIIGTILFLIVIYTLQYTIGLPFWNNTVSAVNISILHSVFNVSSTVVLLPFSGLLVWLSNNTIRTNDKEEQNLFAVLDERFLSTPPIAVANARKAMGDMFDLAKENVSNCKIMLRGKNASLTDKMRENEEMLDKYEIELSNYLTKIADLSLSTDDVVKMTGYLRMVSNIERIGDYCDNVCECIEKMAVNKVTFSAKAEREMNTLFDALENVVELAREALSSESTEVTLRIEPLEEVIDGLCEELETAHMARLKAKKCTVEAGILFLEIIGNGERISDHCSNIGISILQSKEEFGDNFDRHKYLRKLHEDTDGEYRRYYNMYKERFAL